MPIGMLSSGPDKQAPQLRRIESHRFA